MSVNLENLAKLREPFPPKQVSKLPKPTKQQTDAVKNDYRNGIRCTICGGWHHKDVIHLDYVGHAALTDRLLTVDPEWTWEPMATDDRGLPAFDGNGGLWIRLTVCGMTRIGYGDAGQKTGGDAIKEAIGDALRNAAMRFGAALDLWHKGDLHGDDETGGEEPPKKPEEPKKDVVITSIEKCTTIDELVSIWESLNPEQRKKYNAVKERKKSDLMTTGER